jgi:hypothetical protein
MPVWDRMGERDTRDKDRETTTRLKVRVMTKR